jgi:hypothetical protein
MEPQTTKNARIANEFRPRPVKGIGGNGQARVALVDGTIVGVELNNAERSQVALYPGAALKLAEQLIHAARKAQMADVVAKDTNVDASTTTAPIEGAA